MNQAATLHGCRLLGAFADEHDPLQRALAMQARALGIAVESVSDAGREQIYCLQGQGLAPTHCRLTGWDDEATRAISEFTLQAACGLMAVHGRASGQARAIDLDYLAHVVASLALTGLMATALARLRGGQVTDCSVSLPGAGLQCISQYLAGATAEEGAERLPAGCSSARLRPPFVSADGVVFELETLDAGPWLAFWDGLGVARADSSKGWQGFLLRYARAIAPMPEALCRTLASLPYAQVVEHCTAVGMAVTPVHQPGQRDTLTPVGDTPWAFKLHPVAVPSRPCNQTLPLSGLRVIESCRRIQGPLAGHLLAMLGAQVTRLEMPGGDPLRGMAPLAQGCSVRFDALNGLKAVVELDLKSASEREQLRRNIAEVDVFLHNWAPGKAEELALDQADLAQVNPALIYAYAGGWGNAQVPVGLPGTDFTVQAWSGIAHLIGQGEGNPGGSLFTVLDVFGGVIAAQGIVAALLARHLHGHAGRVDSSLLGAADLLCRSRMTRTRPLSAGVFRCQDASLAIDCCAPEHLETLARVFDFPMPCAWQTLREPLALQLARQPAAHWQARLLAAGVPVAIVRQDLAELQQDPRLVPWLAPGRYTRVLSPWRFT
ncbi:CoA transferase [Pseudomonas monteilii]|uniref:CoA transferase n=1 Tax=Pseudomonas monteilii TaxID=76759 RepID=UPI001CBC474F|nr:CoA transferase [Pseudomonas monteilii]MBZ3663971.1 CoA transferase [Pseudomonas monteilii]MBZ3669316.1 CoA transferase [Pseudomonas monteilii]